MKPKTIIFFMIILLALIFSAATCPPKPPTPKIWITICNDFPDMPAVDARVANEYCPAVHPAQYVQGAEPKVLCSKHIKPEPPICARYPISNVDRLEGCGFSFIKEEARVSG